MKKLIKNSKLRRALSVTGHIIGTLSFIFIIYAVITTWTDPNRHIVAPAQVTTQMDSDPSYLPEHVVIRSRVKEVKKIPLYGYGYKVSDRMYIVNFSRLKLKPGDPVRFRIKGAAKINGIYLVNADYE